jgi:hypothetical protein
MCGRIERAPGAGGQLGQGSDRYALSWVSAVRAVTTLVPFAGAVEGRGCCCAPAANNGQRPPISHFELDANFHYLCGRDLEIGAGTLRVICMNANTFLRHRAMPLRRPVGMIVSCPVK